jgi:hypothetical protein
MNIKNIFTPIMLFLSMSTVAQIEKIDTDRPDQTESPFTVPKKWMQFEMGILKESNRDPYITTLDLKDKYFQHPTLLTKYGLTNCFELRLITEFATYRFKQNNNITERKNGINTIQLGGKVNFLKESGIKPKTSLIAHYDFGGLRTVNKDTIDGANFRFTMQHTVSKTVSISYNLGMEWNRFGFSPAYIYTFSPSFTISDKWYAYIEAFGFIYKNEKPENSIDGGFAFYVNDNLKLDLSAGFGINKKAPDNYFAAGASYRFKTTK